jgi:hypothetical protein
MKVGVAWFASLLKTGQSIFVLGSRFFVFLESGVEKEALRY